MRPSREEWLSHPYFRYFFQAHFPRAMPEELRGIFSDLEWLDQVIRPLDDISWMIFPRARHSASFAFLLVGFILCVFTKMLPQIALTIFVCLTLLGLMNRYLSTRWVGDIYLNRLMILLNEHHARKHVSFRYTAVRESSSYTLRYVTISIRRRSLEPVADVDEHESAVIAVSCNNLPFIAIPIKEERDLEAQ